VESFFISFIIQTIIQLIIAVNPNAALHIAIIMGVDMYQGIVSYQGAGLNILYNAK
jgi:hypothetical protein